MRTTAAQRDQATEAIAKLCSMLKPGDTVHTILRHCSRSGMQRSISLVIQGDDGPVDITYLASRAMQDRIDQKNGGIKVGGCGMDMGFHIVYNLSYTLYPDGFDCIGDEVGKDFSRRCPSNDHSNREHNTHHKDGGYALRHRWL